MAVINDYVNPGVVAKTPVHPIAGNNGSDIVHMRETFEVLAGDDDGSIYRVFKAVPCGLIPLSAGVYSDAITGGTSFDLGLYDSDLGAVVNKSLFMSAQSLASATTYATGPNKGMSNLNIDTAEKKLWELAGHTTSNKRVDYDICLTANTVGSVDGTVTVEMWFAKAN